MSGMGGSIDIGQKGYEVVIRNHEPDLLVTKVRCYNLPDSDWGDFRYQHALDSSIFLMSFCDHEYFLQN